MKRLTCMLVLATAFLSNTAMAEFDVPSGEYVLEETHGYITFSYSHLGFSTPHVGFDTFSVNLQADQKNPANSKVSVDIDATSINSRVDLFDEHLNGPDYFDTANYPKITFNSTSIKQTSATSLEVNGDLTIKEVTKPATLNVTINKAAIHPMRKVPTIGMSAQGKVSRTELGLGKYAPAVGDEVTIYVTAELIKAVAE